MHVLALKVFMRGINLTNMTIKQKFNEYIASGDISISDEQRDWILPFIERCVGEERERVMELIAFMYEKKAGTTDDEYDQCLKDVYELLTTQEDKIK